MILIDDTTEMVKNNHHINHGFRSDFDFDIRSNFDRICWYHIDTNLLKLDSDFFEFMYENIRVGLFLNRVGLFLNYLNEPDYDYN